MASRRCFRPLTLGEMLAAEGVAEAVGAGNERKEERPVEPEGLPVPADWGSSWVCTKRWMRLVWGGRRVCLFPSGRHFLSGSSGVFV